MILGIPQRGVWYGSQGPQRSVIGRCLADLRSRPVSARAAPLCRRRGPFGVTVDGIAEAS